MCFEVLPLNPHGAEDKDDDEDGASPVDADGSDVKSSKRIRFFVLMSNNYVLLFLVCATVLTEFLDAAEQNPAELESLNLSLQELLDGIQEDFYAVVDWAYKIDPLRCISMQGVTERYLSAQKADAAGFVRRLLADLQSRISLQFNRVCLHSS